MNTESRYRSYPDPVKNEIARTGNIYLFPEMKIPRTTAQYWVKKKKSFATVSEIARVILGAVFSKREIYLTAIPN